MTRALLIIFLALAEQFHVRVSERVNALFSVTYAKKMSLHHLAIQQNRLHQATEKQFLRIVGVLIFVHHDVTEPSSHFIGNIVKLLFR